MSFILIGSEYLSVGLEYISQKVSIYQYHLSNEDIKDNKVATRLCHSSFFVFRGNQKGQIDIGMRELLSDNKKREIYLTILLSPDSAKEILAQKIKENELKNPHNSKYKNITKESILTPTIQKLRIYQEGRENLFETIEFNNPNLSSNSIELKAVLPKDKAESLYHGLSAPKPIYKYTFKIECTLGAKYIESESHAYFDSISVNTTKAVLDLDGVGRAFKWDTNIGYLSSDEVYITRNQKSDFEGALKKEVKSKYQIQDERDLELLELKLQRYFDDVFEEKELDLESGVFGKELSKLSEYNFSEYDIHPDKIEKLSNNIRKSYTKENEDYLKWSAEIDTKGKALSLFEAEAKYKADYESRKKRKLVDDKDWKFETEGKQIVPKSLKVYVLSKTKLKAEKRISMSIQRAKRDEIRTVSLINTDTFLTIEDYKTRYENAKLNTTPIGTILPFASDKIPTGWNLCNGAEIPIEGNQELFDVIGHTWKGTSIVKKGFFKVPNFQGFFLRGATNKVKIGTQQDDTTSLPRTKFTGKTSTSGVHKHSLAPYSQCSLKGGRSNGGPELSRAETRKIAAHTQNDGGHNHAIIINGGGDSETRPKNYSVNYIIRVN